MNALLFPPTKRLWQLVAMFAILACSFSAHAAGSPVALLENVTNNLLQSMKQNQSSIRGNPRRVESLVRSHVLPHMDVDSMSRSVLGRQAWEAASSGQQAQFKQSFQSLVIRTYSTALAEYDNQTIRYAPIRGSYQGKRFIQVNSVINQSSGPNIRVNYRLVLQGGAWKVYDFSVDGISMVQSYRSQFSSIVNQKGMDGLLAKLKTRR